MIGIRSITYQLPEQYTREDIEEIARLSRKWDRNFSPIKTQRVSLCPFYEKGNLADFRKISKLCDLSSIRWFSVPLLPYHSRCLPELFNFGYSVLAEYGRAFINVLGVTDEEIRPEILNRCTEFIRKTSLLSANGKDNFRLGISINVQPDGPFFPFTYSSGEKGFSIALELTQEINELCTQSRSMDLQALREEILRRIMPQIEHIHAVAKQLSENAGFVFHGFDFSLAPSIGENGSILTILNHLGVFDFGRAGTLFATSYLTDILKYLSANFPSIGFSGVMYSLLEDLELCAVNNQRGITLDQLISLSTMCGCGVDMVPVYGQIKNEELLSVFLDVAGISCRLHKPLGIRVLPIPGCRRGMSGFTNFHNDSDFVANTKIVDLNLNLIIDPGNNLQYLTIGRGSEKNGYKS